MAVEDHPGLLILVSMEKICPI